MQILLTDIFFAAKNVGKLKPNNLTLFFEINESVSDQNLNETILEARIEEQLSGRDRPVKVIVLSAFARY